MKSRITYILFGVLALASCRKTRTCSCAISGTTVKTSIPRNGGFSSVQTYPTEYTTEKTSPGVTKKDLRRNQFCNTRTIKTSSTYTASATSSDTTVVISDVYEEQTTEFDCSIK
jgi:hypothetical protein